jgi:hypothetical protein
MNDVIAQYPPDTKEYQMAKDMAFGKMSFQQFRTLYAYSRDANAKTNIYALATVLNPNFNASLFESGLKIATNEKTYQQLTALDNASSRIADVKAISDKALRSGVTTLNKLIIGGGYVFGNTTYSDFKTVQKLFADEVSGALGFGTASDMKLKLGVDISDPNMTPQQFASALDQISVFLDSKKASMLSPINANPTVSGMYGGTEVLGPPSPTSNNPSDQYMISPDGTQQVKISDLTPDQIQEAKNANWK